MVEQAQSLVDEGVDRVQEALKSADKEFQKVQRRVKTQRRTIERRLESQRRNIEKAAQKQIKALRKSDWVKRAESFGSEVQEQLETGIESLLSAFQIASKSDIQRVDRKLARISKRLKELEASPQG